MTSPPSSRSGPPRSIPPPAAERSLRAAREGIEAGIARATAAAARLAPRYLMSRTALADSIVDVDVRTETYERLLALVERRSLLLDMAPAKGARKKTSELHDLPEPTRYDPFTVDPRRIADQTRVTCLCPQCDGSGHTKCRRCLGTGHVDCRLCRATGRVGEAPCPTCQGAAVVACGSCTSGRVRCVTCAGGGRVFAWLRLETRITEHVAVAGDPAGIQAHEQVESPTDFEAGPGRWKNELYYDSGLVDELEGVEPSLLPRLDPRSARIKSMRYQGFSSGVYAVRYATPLGAGTIEVAGIPPVVLRSSHKRPLRLRRALLVALAVAGVVLAVMVAVGRATLHPWMRAHGAPLLLFGLTLAASIAGTVAVAALLLPSKARRLARVAAPMAVALLFTGATVATAKLLRPRVAHARALAAAGDLRGARDELSAVIALGLDPGAAALDDELHAEQLAQARGLDEKRRIAEQPFWREEGLTSARAAVLEAATAALDEALPSGSPATLFALGDTLRPIEPALALRAFDAGAGRQVAECIATGALVCEFRGSELGDARREALEAEIEVSRARAELKGDDYDALVRRLGRWTREPLASKADAIRGEALARLDEAMRQARGEEAQATTLEDKRRLVAAELGLVRSMKKLGRGVTVPALEVLLQRSVEIDRALAARAGAARPTWR